MVFLASDNTSGIHPQIMQAIAAANDGDAKAYGADALSLQLTETFRKVFEHPHLLVYPAFNGSAANCLGLASMTRPFEAIIAHLHSHIEQDECGMPEFFTGAKLMIVNGAEGKIEREPTEHVIRLANANGIHHSRPKVLSITQSTEFGTVYTPEEIKALSTMAKKHGMNLHMDGARLANALASLKCTPAETTWKAGVEVMSFGCTKNGTMLAEAVIFFEPDLAYDFEHLRKRAGQLASKQRFISAQLLSMFENDLWLKNAGHANAMATKLATSLKKILQLEIINPVDANTLFVKIPESIAAALMKKGHYFYHWPIHGDDVYRFVTSFETKESDIESFLKDTTQSL